MSPRIIAAVDLGSNSFHMVVASINENGTLKIIDRIKEMVRLGSGFDSKSNINESTQERALDCLKRFSQRLQNIHPNDVRIAGTNSLRIARNNKAFIKKAKRLLNHNIEIISGTEEARLVYHGAVYSLAELGEKRLVIDIGGGSTELIIGKNNKPKKLESLEMGCVSISRLFFENGIINEEKLIRADIFARQKIEEIRHNYLKTGWQQVVGTSGSIRSISKVLLANDITDGTITASSLSFLLNQLLIFGEIKKIELKGLNNNRQAVFIGGLVVLNAVFKSLKITKISVSDGALREGLLLDMVGRIQQKDIRKKTVQKISERYDTRINHASNIILACNHLYKSVKKKWLLKNENTKLLLQWSASLHEIGLAISHAAYHKHSAYLVQHSDMPGFSLQEQTLLSFFIRFHRQKININELNNFSTEYKNEERYLLIIFRLAIILNRSIPIYIEDSYSIEAEENTLTLRLAKNWPDENPLTYADLKNEVDYLTNINFKLKIK